jgi:NAD kinase
VSIAPRIVVVHRRTEREEIVRQAGTWGQAKYLQKSRGVSLAKVEQSYSLTERALQAVSAAIPGSWRRGAVERSDLDRFLFEPEDVVVVVGQDGLVANTAKYLDGQPVIGVNPDPATTLGVLVRHPPGRLGQVLGAVADGRAATERRTMVAAATGDGQELNALNEIYLGHPGHQSARYRLALPDGREEAQSSSGLLVGTGTGATGWLLSVARERDNPFPLPRPAEPTLGWFVREAWPSPTTGATLTEGLLAEGAELRVLVQSETLTVFGDGIEADRLTPAWGQTVSLRASSRQLTLVV